MTQDQSVCTTSPSVTYSTLGIWETTTVLTPRTSTTEGDVRRQYRSVKI